MFMDSSLEFADAASVGTPNNSIVNVGNTIDMGSVLGNGPGAGQPLYLNIMVSTTITSGGAASVRFRLVSDSSATPATDETTTAHFLSDTILVTSLLEPAAGEDGFSLSVPLPEGRPVYERFLGIQVEETAGQVLTAGAINAFLSLTPFDNNVPQPDAAN
jgi:hypothetical protein